MQYFEAVQEGRRRVNKAVQVLQEVAGPSYPMLFLKIGITDWTPVGEEMLQAIVPGKGGLAAIVICDSEGNSKAMTPMLSATSAEKFSDELTKKGIQNFDGEVKLPS